MSCCYARCMVVWVCCKVEMCTNEGQPCQHKVSISQLLTSCNDDCYGGLEYLLRSPKDVCCHTCSGDFPLAVVLNP